MENFIFCAVQYGEDLFFPNNIVCWPSMQKIGVLEKTIILENQEEIGGKCRVLFLVDQKPRGLYGILTFVEDFLFY